MSRPIHSLTVSGNERPARFSENQNSDEGADGAILTDFVCIGKSTPLVPPEAPPD